MKVLFITSLLGKEYGGAEVSTNLLLTKLLERNCTVQALTTRKVNDDKLISISFPVEIPKKLLTLGNNLIDYLLAKKIKNQLIKIKPEVIHVQDTYILAATVAANKTLKIPCVATIRNSVIDSTWDLMFPKPIATMLKSRNKTIIRALNNVDCIISVSEYIKSELIQRGLAKEKIVTIYNLPPVFDKEISVYKKHESLINLFAPGLISKFKGFSILIEAMKKVTENESNICLTIAGDGPEKTKLEKNTRKLGLDKYIIFTGKIPFAKLSEYYSKSDIVIFPSIYPEPFGRVALEAMFFEKPVIASRVGGIPEVVTNKETGLLVSPGNVDELANAIILLVKDSKLRILLGERGHSIGSTKFNINDILDAHIEIYTHAQSINKGC